ncbi:MAG: 8-oxo-dGTP diphosphatase MutT [Verrucomicrobia bacterium]|nr:8-oxo-dGTP diphosphatase MutT [Verrucomicrobiota bacterium]
MKRRETGALASAHHSSLITHTSIEVAAGLVFRTGKLLITQRRPQDHLGGLWEFPGGKREPGETFGQCLRRELREELGVEAIVGELIEELTHVYPEKTVHLQFFLCTLAAGSPEPQPHGCHALAWITRDELERHAFPAADARLLQRLRDHAGWWR